MAAKINKTALGSLTAKAFYTLLKEGLDDNSIYAGVSYIPDSDWQDYTLGHFDSDAYNDSESTFYGGLDSDYDEFDETYYNQAMYSMHKVYTGGISRVISRSDWTYGETYNAYPEANNYVLVKEYVSGYSRLNVYQCLFAPRTPSYYAPSGTSQDPVALSDGYYWKYMYSISNSQAIRFMNNKWMPCAEKIKNSEMADITTSSENYEQYISQINAEAGLVYAVSLDSDLFFAAAKWDSDLARSSYYDSDLSVAIGQNSYVELIGRDVASNTPSRYMKIGVSWNAATNSWNTSLIESGKGYVGPLTFGLDSDSAAIAGVSATVAPGAGHGSDVPRELEASHIMISVRNIADDTSSIVYSGSKYNLLSLHMDPVDAETGEIATAEFYATCPYLELDGNNQYVVGDIIRPKDDDGRRAQVVSVADGNLYYIPTKEGQSTTNFADSETIVTLNNQKEVVIKTSHSRAITLNSSQMIIADRKPQTITREEGQIEAFNFVLSF